MTKAGRAAFLAMLQEAMDLRLNGSLREAHGILRDLERKAPDQRTLVGLLALVLYELGRTEEAVDYFFRSTRLSPDSEISSLGLYHCLRSLGRVEEAFDEMRRFLSANESIEYRRILTELTREGTG